MGREGATLRFMAWREPSAARESPARGPAAAQFLMGAMAEEGWGQAPDYVEAYTWYSLAAPRVTEAKAVHPKYDPVAARDSLATRMNRHQIERAEKKVLEWQSSR